jgi:prepilin-type N-terminal cleavage/methylation domain-containing protein
MMNPSACEIRRPTGALRARRGFTLVELLVVMVVIAVLMSLTAAGVMAWRNAQGRANTDATLKGLQQILAQHWDAVVTETKKERIWSQDELGVTIPSTYPQTLYLPSGSATKDFADNDPDRARILMIKIRLMEAFPMNFNEVPAPGTDPYATPAGGPFNPLSLIPFKKRRPYRAAYQSMIYDPVLKVAKYKLSTQTGRESVESAVCLYAALSTSKQGINLQSEQLKAWMQDVDSTGNPVLADHWGTPFRFYRFATQNFDSANTKDSMLALIAPPAQVVSNAVDPLDPNGKLLNWTLFGQAVVSPNAATYDSTIHKRIYVNGSGISMAQNAIPIIASAGPDGKFGTPAVDPRSVSGVNSAGFQVYAGTAPYSDMTAQPVPLPATGGDEKDNLYSVKRPS